MCVCVGGGVRVCVRALARERVHIRANECKRAYVCVCSLAAIVI